MPTASAYSLTFSLIIPAVMEEGFMYRLICLFWIIFFSSVTFSQVIKTGLLCPRPVGGGGGGIKRWSASVVRLSVCLMSRTSALTRKPKGLGRRTFAQGYPRSHATPTPTAGSKGQKSRSRGGGILWRPPSRTACLVLQPLMNDETWHWRLMCRKLAIFSDILIVKTITCWRSFS